MQILFLIMTAYFMGAVGVLSEMSTESWISEVRHVTLADTLVQDRQDIGADTLLTAGQIVGADTILVGDQTDTLGVAAVGGIDGQTSERESLRRVAEAGVVGESQDGIGTMEIDGMIVDETVTRFGRDFYDAFYGFWQRPPGAVNFTVVVEEQPSPSLGTRVVVKVNDEISFQTQLQPRLEMIEAAARQGVAFTYRFVQGLSSREHYVY